MQSLYSRLASRWDCLFPPDSSRESFLTGLLDRPGSKSRVIEVGCGTGASARAMAAAGHSIAASDLDPEMVAVAVRSAGDTAESDTDFYPQFGKVRFTIDDMIGALGKAPPSSAGLAACLGNTLPHLTREGELERFFTLSAAALGSGGYLVIQILNYPLILRQGGMNLPDLESDGVIFRRRQAFGPQNGLVLFHTEVEADGRLESRTHSLKPVSITEMSELAVEAGLEPAGVYSDWNGTAFTDENWFVSLWRKWLPLL